MEGFMKKYELMQIADDTPSNIYVYHPNGELERIKVTMPMLRNKANPFIQTINQYTNQGWRVSAVGPASTTAGLFTPSAATQHTVYLEREVE